MTGYHEVRVFMVSRENARLGWALPNGWKPFAAYRLEEGLYIVARKWHKWETG